MTRTVYVQAKGGTQYVVSPDGAIRYLWCGLAGEPWRVLSRPKDPKRYVEKKLVSGEWIELRSSEGGLPAPPVS